MQHDRSSPDDLRTGGRLPTQRAEATPGRPATPGSDEPTVAYTADAETMVLPVFVTGKKPEQPPGREPVEVKSVPDSERGMLVFVAALLGIGTVAVVTMMGFGLTGPPAKAKTKVPTPSVVSSPSAAPVAPVPVPSTSATPSTPASHASPTRHRSPTPSPTPTVRALGTLGPGDPTAYCTATTRSTAHAPDDSDPSWFCRRNHTDFTPTTVCRWRFSDGTAFAVVGDLENPASWRCYT